MLENMKDVDRKVILLSACLAVWSSNLTNNMKRARGKECGSLRCHIELSIRVKGRGSLET